MEPITLLPRRARIAVLTVAVLLLAGCSGSADAPAAGVAPPALPVVPTAWIDATTAAWPDSDGRRSGVMVVGGSRECALGDERLRLLDTEFGWFDAGYGPVDARTDSADSFVHRCGLSDTGRRAGDYDTRGRAAGGLTLTRYADAAGVQEEVARFRAQTDTPVQDNEVTRLTSGRYTVEALRRWYPTNPQGCYQAMVVDEQQRTTLLLEVNSLTREDFEAISAQQVADALTDFLERSHVAPTAAAPVVPDWADSLWEDAQDRFRIPVAKGWSHDPADGRMEDLAALPKFSSSDGSASVVVLPTGLKDPLTLPAVVEKSRAVYATQPGARFLSDEPMDLDDGTPAHRVDFTISGGRRLLSVLVVTDDHLFQIIGTAPASRWESTQGVMMRMARSFTT